MIKQAHTTIEENKLIDTLGSFASVLEVLSTEVNYPLQPNYVKVNSKYSVGLKVSRDLHASSECKIEIELRGVSNSSNLPVHVITLTKQGYLSDASSIYYTVYSKPFYRGNVKSDLVSGRTTYFITVSDLETVVLGDNLKPDVFKAFSLGLPSLLDFLFTSCGLNLHGVK